MVRPLAIALERLRKRQKAGESAARRLWDFNRRVQALKRCAMPRRGKLISLWVEKTLGGL